MQLKFSLFFTLSEEVQPEKVKKVKRKKDQSVDTQCKKLQAHAECEFPHSCKKCRIMRRLGENLFLLF